MTTPTTQTASLTRTRRGRFATMGPLAFIAALYCVISCIGISWGLPSRKIDKYLFGDGEVWSGEKIHRLSKAGEKFSAQVRSSAGADVDLDPLRGFEEGVTPKGSQAREFSKGIPLTQTEEDVAKIYLRYRLYTYQPDEMITMMALAGMRPGEWSFDPRLYQYGGLFIYPVGALIRLCGVLGLIDVRSDLIFYLDNPDEFGKFYIVARAYSALWGLLGVVLVFAITRRIAVELQISDFKSQTSVLKSQISDFKSQISDFETQKENLTGLENQGSNLEDRVREKPVSNIKDRMGTGTGSNTFTGAGSIAGLLAAMLFTLMPVVVCMSHEGKPHLPGAVLMLLAVYFAMRSVVSNRQSTIDNRKSFWLMCVACGAATGMVLSSWPICVLIPLVVGLQWRMSNGKDRGPIPAIVKTIAGAIAAVGVYLATNPYVLINLFANREVLRSNFGNSLAMYEVARVGEGFVRVLELMIEGATLPVVICGFLAAAVAIACCRRAPHVWLLIVPAMLFFIQFILIGAGKPAEFGRFAIFSNTILAVGGVLLLTTRHRVGPSTIGLIVIFSWALWSGGVYVAAFYQDSQDRTTRTIAAEVLATRDELIFAVPVEPAPYSFPALDFSSRRVVLASEQELPEIQGPYVRAYIDPRRQPAPISWASKWVTIDTGEPHTWAPLRTDDD